MSVKVSKFCAGVSALAVLPTAAALAQSVPGEGFEDIGEIVVTAQKRSERLADVPMSISVVTGDALSRAGIVDTAQLVQAVPGFNYQQGAFGTPVFSIRGIGYNDNSTSAGPAVTVYIDQVALPYSVMSRGAMLDLERVEVLKGPQGTLFGMNSTGGAINFIAAKPTDVFDVGASVGFARFNEISFNGFVSGPIADRLSARIAVQGEFSDGWQYSRTRPSDRLGKKDFLNGRAIFDWKPSESLSFELALSAWRDKGETQAAQFVDFAPAVAVTPLTQYIADAMEASPLARNNAREADWDVGRDYARNDRFHQASLRVDWSLSDDVSLTSISAYNRFKGSSPMDIDGTAFSAFGIDAHDSDLETFAQELRLAGSSGMIDWMIGGNYQYENAAESTITTNQGTNNQIGPFLFTRLGQIADQKVDTLSAFGSLDVHVTDQLTLQGAVRYTSQKRDFSGCIKDEGLGPVGVTAATAFEFLGGLFTGTPVSIPAFGCVTLDAATFAPGLAKSELDEDNLSWRAGIDYKFDTNVMAYANVTKGYKSGSYALVPAILSSQFTPVTQEAVLAYEAGTRFTTFGGVLSADFAAFYNDYDDKQLKGIVLTPVFGPLPQLVNIPKSKVYGFEANVTLQPTKGLRLKSGLTYIRSKVLRDPVAPAVPRDPYGVPTSYLGETFPNTPKWQFVGDAEYRFPIGSGGMQVMVGSAVTYHSSSPGTFGNTPAFTLPAYTLLDARLGLESADGRWSGQIWGRNITNEYYYNNVTHLTDYVAKIAGMPATYGVTFQFRY